MLKCTGDEANCDTTGSDMRAASYVATINPEFNKILSRFHDDNVGTICKTDPMITVVGKALWERSVRKDKKTVMGEMRKLGNLLHVARTMTKNNDLTGNDMLCPKNFRTVVNALNELTAKEDNSLKAGLKLSLGYLLKKAARFTKCELIIDGDDEEVKERDKFLSVLDGSWGYLFNSAQIELESNRETCLRRPRSLPLESDVQTLRTYVMTRISTMVKDEYMVWTASEFIELRSLLVCRLTLFKIGFLMRWYNMSKTQWKNCWSRSIIWHTKEEKAVAKWFPFSSPLTSWKH